MNHSVCILCLIEKTLVLLPSMLAISYYKTVYQLLFCHFRSPSPRVSKQTGLLHAGILSLVEQLQD